MHPGERHDDNDRPSDAQRRRRRGQPSTHFHTDLLGFGHEGQDGPFTAVRVSPATTLQLAPWGTDGGQHLAFALPAAELDAAFARVKSARLPYGDTFHEATNMRGPGNESVWDVDTFAASLAVLGGEASGLVLGTQLTAGSVNWTVTDPSTRPLTCTSMTCGPGLRRRIETSVNRCRPVIDTGWPGSRRHRVNLKTFGAFTPRTSPTAALPCSLTSQGTDGIYSDRRVPDSDRR